MTSRRLNAEVRSVTIVANTAKPRALQEVARLRDWLRRRGITVVSNGRLARADGIITLGGDGTILSVAPRAAEAGLPVLGVNIGRLGFLTAFEVGDLYQGVAEWLDGQLVVSERTMIEVEWPGHPRPLVALNDVVIRVGATPRVTTVSAAIENEKLGSFTGDGVIIATATGSTAYSLAAQGPIIHPDVGVFVLTPICPHSVNQRPVVYPSDHTMVLELLDGRPGTDVQLCLDGQRVYRLRPGQRVYVRRSAYKLKLLRHPNVSFFGILREKLSWGGR